MHYGFLACFGSLQLSGDCSITHYINSVRKPENFRQFRGNKEDALDLVLGYKNIYYDTAMSCELGDAEFLGLVERIGIDKVLFGTDFPWYDIRKAVDYTRNVLGADAEKIFKENPGKLLVLP